MNYKNAFKCGECPQSGKENGCPAWNEVIMTNPQSGETKIEAGCFYRVLPALLIESIKASNVSAQTHAQQNTEVARGFALMAQSMPGFLEALAAGEAEEVRTITPGEDG